MGSFMRKLFAPWTAGDCFDDLDDFYDFLLRRNKLLNAVRVVLFVVAAVCLFHDRLPFVSVHLVSLFYRILTWETSLLRTFCRIQMQKTPGICARTRVFEEHDVQLMHPRERRAEKMAELRRVLHDRLI